MSARERSPHPPLVFVHLGPELPEYAKATLRFAARSYTGKVLLLTDRESQTGKTAPYSVENIQTWYDRRMFLRFHERSSLDASFRDGFWLHVVERFFVLRQFMERAEIDKLFHAELDVMVFDLELVAEGCDEHGHGIFAVMDDPSRALASLFYVNSTKCFDSFLNFVLNNADAKNEMLIIGKFLQDFPSCGHSLPSDRFFDRKAHPLSPSSVPDRLGLFDANAFGQWLFGVDPRNLGGPSKNKFWNEMAKFRIDRLRFHFGLVSRRLTVSMPGGESRQLRTLHVHSKITPRLLNAAVLHFYLLVNRLPVRIVVTHRKGYLQALLLARLLRGRGFIVAGFLSRYFGALSRPVFEYLSKASTVHLSQRQARRLGELVVSAGKEKETY